VLMIEVHDTSTVSRSLFPNLLTITHFQARPWISTFKATLWHFARLSLSYRSTQSESSGVMPRASCHRGPRVSLSSVASSSYRRCHGRSSRFGRNNMECPLAHPPWMCQADFSFDPGPLMYLTVGGQGILVINTHRVAADLLDRRGNIYSDRPRMISEYQRCPQPLLTSHHHGQWPTRSYLMEFR